MAECSANDGQVDSTAVADGHLLIGAGPWNSAEVRLRVEDPVFQEGYISSFECQMLNM
jgi:hypothetical protein